jgi:hypothetical protein
MFCTIYYKRNFIKYLNDRFGSGAVLEKAPSLLF